MGLVLVIVIDAGREWYRVLIARSLPQRRLAASA
jgi:hypothetical protein